MDAGLVVQGDGSEKDAGALSRLCSAAPALGAHLACDVSGGGAGRGALDLCDVVVDRLIAGGRLEAAAYDMPFYDMLATHFGRFSQSYHLYVKTVNAEDVILHMKLLEEAKDPDRCPALHVRKAEEPTVDLTTNCDDAGDAIFTMPGLTCSNTYEIIFASVHHSRLLGQLSTILYDVGLNVRHAHIFHTRDGFGVCAFTAEDWHSKSIIDLVEELKISISTNEELKTPNSPASSSNSSDYATASESKSLASYATTPESARLERKQAEELKQQRVMKSFRAISSDSISFLLPAILAIFTSSLEFHDYEKVFLILVFSMGGLLILLNMVLSHGLEDGKGRTGVVSNLSLLTVIYVFGVFEYSLYKFFPAGDYQVTALHCIGAHFIFGVIVIRWLWANSFKTSC